MRWILLLLAFFFEWARVLLAWAATIAIPLTTGLIVAFMMTSPMGTGQTVLRLLGSATKGGENALQELKKTSFPIPRPAHWCTGLVAGWITLILLIAIGIAPPFFSSMVSVLTGGLIPAVVICGILAEWKFSKIKHRQAQMRILTAALIAMFVIGWTTGGESGGRAAQPPGGGIASSDLVLTAATVNLQFGDWWTGTRGGHGSAGVLHRDKDFLILITNSHCLGFDELAGRWFRRELTQYSVDVQFSSGERRPVLSFADGGPGVDLALLAVDARGLREGRDYRILPQNNLQPAVGNSVVAVGSPLHPELSGTHTWGRIGAVRNAVMGQGSGARPIRLLQIDAAINPGNSGGPLFLQQGDNYSWIGINTWGIGSGSGLGIAIDYREVFNTEFEWLDLNLQNAERNLRRYY